MSPRNSSERFLSAELDRRGDSFPAALSVRSAPASGAVRRNDAARAFLSDDRVSVHEAGHGVAGRACGLSIRLATIDPEVAGEGRAGCVFGTPDDYACKELQEFSDAPLFELVPPCADDFTTDELSFVAELRVKMYARIIQALAGTAAERLFFPDVTPMVATTDVQQAAALAKLIASDLKAAAALLDFARKDSARIVAAHRDQIAALADALIIERTLNGAAIDDILAGVSPAMRAERARRKEWAAMVANVERSGLQMTLRV
jgi:hypothetical protein